MAKTMKDATTEPCPSQIHEAIQVIVELAATGRTVLVGIDGGAGAGKTSFARLLTARAFCPCPSCSLIASIAPLPSAGPDLLKTCLSAKIWTGSDCATR